jgi:hypothetical protein
VRVAMRILLLATIATTGCEFLSPTPLQCGTFAGRVGGAAADSVTGCAYFATDPISGEFGMVLTHGGPQGTTHKIKLFAESTPQGPGVYQIGSFFTGLIFLGTRSFSITSGTITIASVSRSGRVVLRVNGLAGSLDLTGAEVGSNAPLTLKGSFEALCVADPEFDDRDPAIKDSVCGSGGAGQLRLQPRP